MEDVGEAIIDGWELVYIGPDGFELKLNFTNPLMVSTDDEPDLLLV